MRTADLVERLRWAAHPRLYAAQLPERLASGASSVGAAEGQRPIDVDATVRHYLSYGAQRGLRLCALFAPEWYAAALAEGGGEVPSDPTALFFHWLTVGWEQRIVPTPLFDADWFAHRHPRLAARLARSGRWSFEHYLAQGCYHPEWVPSPLGRHHPGGDAARDPATGDPLLMRELLHRASEFDLARTSWLEEGQRAALARLSTLESPRMRELFAKAAALDPAVRHTSRTPFTTVPPYRTRRLYLAQQAEAVRRAVGLTHADVVVLVSGRHGAAAPQADLLGLAADDSTLVVATDIGGTGDTGGAGGTGDPGDTDSGDAGGPNAPLHFGLAPYAAGLEARQRLDLLLDLLRGVTPRRVVLLDSELGREAALAYGRQLSALCGLEVMAAGDLLPYSTWVARGTP